MVLWLAIASSSFSSFCTGAGISKFAGDSLSGLPIGPFGIIVVMMVIVFVMGMFIESLAVIMITLPIFMPVVLQLGFDPLWFALTFTINIMIAIVTPPVAMTLFYLKGILPADVKMADIYRSVIPYVFLELIVLVIALLWPPLLTWLPNKMI